MVKMVMLLELYHPLRGTINTDAGLITQLAPATPNPGLSTMQLLTKLLPNF